ncbi:MAG: tRNA 4-thiouridine(8) synthase ThiI [Nitrospira sp.]|nr:tRNA 4-thiouridine(8) synthase ThiI [Nitrospira sp.]MBP0121622.1 tRNA 4-thiouridine(8) synthase ThiI [Nitrospira sp.]MBP0123772.1 tRNA 4-thiouridine(8) synthase ThiI [Nitrospira sp.]MBP0126683.1 tRNA 4-thiouridine(8) synthase ThiI [Nitrospira sp.]MBP0129209.1 tRNA 4-thiouridine(8) synthase ThiI [Nitrospira sp.]
MRCAIVHYHEIALKGRNREYFEERLVCNIQWMLKDLGVRRVENLRSRIRVVLPDGIPDQTIIDRLTRVFGIANFSLAHGLPLDLAHPDLGALTQVVIESLRSESFSTFRISAKRADKRLILTSMEVARDVGTAVCEATGKKVSLKDPDLTVYLELLSKQAYYSIKKIQGPGGMPVGVSGKVACLISGGIDSPVAAYRMMKRGCRALFVHFSGRPFVSRASEEKVRELVQLLTAYQYTSKLYVIPFGKIQRDIVASAPAPYRVVLYRRVMIRIAQELAKQEHCWGLVTGDSLGQVASQTPENLTAIQAAAELPLLRPLIGMDKLEITDQAEQIGSFAISIEPDQDCCSLFTPPHPSTKTRLEDILRIEQIFDIDALVKQGLDKAELSQFTFPQ